MTFMCEQYQQHTAMFCCGYQCKSSLLSQECGNVDSPLQLKLIKMLGLQSYVLENFVFRRKPSTYSIKSLKGVKTILLDNQIYQAPQSYHISIDMIETKEHSIPIIRLAPISLKPQGKIPCVVYAHGNASDLGDSLKFMTKMTAYFRAQYIAFDYTGYGQSRRPNVGEDIICKDLQLVLAWLKKPLNEIILWGFSLGTFPVIINAARYSVKAVILQCPIGSLSCMFHENYGQNLRFKEDHFANIDHIANVRGRILMMHSLADQIIPIEQAHLLFKKYIAQNGERHITFIEVDKIKHNDLHRYIVSSNKNDLQREVANFLKNNQKEMEKYKVKQYKNISLDLLYQSIYFGEIQEDLQFDLDKLEITEASSKSFTKKQQWICCRK